MRRLDMLKLTAKQSYVWRGHDMERFVSITKRQCAISNCTVCGMSVVVNTAPSPNGTDIGGTACALNCRKK